MKRLALLILLFATAHLIFAQDSAQTCSSPRQAQGALVGAIRVMNTAEVRYYAVNKRYASMSELMNFEETKKLAADREYLLPVEGSVGIGTADDPLPGYTLRIVLGSDGNSYFITATKKDAPCKRVGAMTDERGLIFFVEPLR